MVNQRLVSLIFSGGEWLRRPSQSPSFQVDNRAEVPETTTADIQGDVSESFPDFLGFPGPKSLSQAWRSWRCLENQNTGSNPG